MRHTWTVLTLVLGIAACGDKKADTGPPVPNQGWNDITVEGPEGPVVTGQCFYPPVWSELGTGDRRMSRQKTLEVMMAQWQGKREEAVNFGDELPTNLETVLFGKPELIERVSQANFKECVKAFESGSFGHWRSWVKAQPAVLTEGECKSPPLDYTLFQPMSVTKGWQIPVDVCAGDRVRIRASAFDQYRIEEGGPWMNAEGDMSRSASNPAYPCNWEGCYLGQVIMRYTSEDGAETVLPVGTELVWEAPGHGRIEVQINDIEWYDNGFKEEGGVIHHTTIEYSPAE